MKYVHKYYPEITIELVEPTAKGYKVYQFEKGKKKIAYYNAQDIKGDRALFEKIN